MEHLHGRVTLVSLPSRIGVQVILHIYLHGQPGTAYASKFVEGMLLIELVNGMTYLAIGNGNIRNMDFVRCVKSSHKILLSLVYLI